MLQAIHLHCKRGQRNLFSDISFELEAGEMLLVQGANGSGKSSLLRLLTGLVLPCSGDIFWQQRSIANLRAAYWDNLHYVGHKNGLKLGLTVIENLQLAGKFSLKWMEVLDFLNLTEFKNIITTHLSAGQQRKLALAKLFLFPKLLWILDEPLAALDKSTQQFFLSQLEYHLKNGGIAVISSHHTILNHHDHPLIKNLRLTPC